MAADPRARRLTEAHRLGQQRLGVATISALRAAFTILDPTDLDATTERWLRVAVPIVQRQNDVSARLASNYLTTFRALEIGTTAGFVPVVAQPVAVDAVTTSLLVTGPARIKKATRIGGAPLVRIMSNAEVSTAGAGMRHALAGGRETILGSVAADRRALGWSRATSGKPCSFCALLASRGPDYNTEKTASFEAHDHCSCTAEPTYSEDAPWPSGSERFRELWDRSTAEAGSTDEALALFRASVAEV